MKLLAPLSRKDARLLGPIMLAIPHDVPTDFESLRQACIEDHHHWYNDMALRDFGDVQRVLDWLVGIGLVRLAQRNTYRLVDPPNPTHDYGPIKL